MRHVAKWVTALICGVGVVAQAADAPPRPFLWKVGESSYLFGTIHLGRPSVTQLAPPVHEAFESAEAVFTEIPMDPGTLLGMTPLMLLPEGETLKTVLSPALYTELDETLRMINPQLSLAPLERMKIWAVTAMLSTLEDQMMDGGLALDLLLFQRAALGGKETGGIETVREQVGIFEDMSRDDQIALLRETLAIMQDELEAGRSPVDDLVAAYRSGDTEKLQAEMERWMPEDPSSPTAKLFVRLLDDRNKLMAERIEKMLREQPGKRFFFAIGAGHLYSENGVPALLEAAGIPVERVE